MANIRIEPNQAQITRLVDSLRGVRVKAGTVVARALNHTLAKMATAANREIRKTYNLSAATVRGKLAQVQANQNKTEAILKGIGAGLSLVNFGARPNTNAPYLRGGKRPRRGVSVLVMKARGRKAISKSFVASIKRFYKSARSGGGIYGDSGAFGIYRRTGEFFLMPAPKPRGMRRRRRGKGVWRRERLSFRLGPGVANTMFNREVSDTITRDGEQMLHDRIEHEMSYALSQVRL